MLIEKTYKTDITKEDKKIKIRSKNVEEYGEVALKIANANKKGWNALMLSDIIDGKVNIPSYILDALVFVSGKALSDKKNYLKILHKYGENYLDTNLLEVVAENYDEDLFKLLENVSLENRKCSAINLLNKVVEKCWIMNIN